MLKNFEELKREGENFRDSGYGELPELAKLQVHTYMRGLKDGMRIAGEAEKKDTEERQPVAV